MAELKQRPAGYGLGPCDAHPHTGRPGRPSSYQCWCGENCKTCGYPKHAAVHRHCLGEKPGDPPFDHEFVPRGVMASDGAQQ